LAKYKLQQSKPQPDEDKPEADKITVEDGNSELKYGDQ
jgi:hypothetical protein